MRNWIFVLEAINAVLGIAVSLQTLPAYWGIVVYAVFVIGFIALFLSDKTLEKQIYKRVMAGVSKKLDNTNQQQGALESVSPEDRNFIYQLHMEMKSQHGHSDPYGLVADRASRVPLNELMFRNCSRCNQPRNEKSSINLGDDYDELGG